MPVKVVHIKVDIFLKWTNKEECSWQLLNNTMFKIRRNTSGTAHVSAPLKAQKEQIHLNMFIESFPRKLLYRIVMKQDENVWSRRYI